MIRINNGSGSTKQAKMPDFHFHYITNEQAKKHENE